MYIELLSLSMPLISLKPSILRVEKFLAKTYFSLNLKGHYYRSTTRLHAYSNLLTLVCPKTLNYLNIAREKIFTKFAINLYFRTIRKSKRKEQKPETRDQRPETRDPGTAIVMRRSRMLEVQWSNLVQDHDSDLGWFKRSARLKNNLYHDKQKKAVPNRNFWESLLKFSGSRLSGFPRRFSFIKNHFRVSRLSSVNSL